VQRDVRDQGAAELFRSLGHQNDTGTGLGQGVAARGRIVQPRPETDDQVGIGEAPPQRDAAAEPEVADVTPAGVRDRVLPAEGGRDRDGILLGKPHHLLADALAPAGPADDEDGTLGGVELG
jgi:hypothetical protein